MSNCCDVTRIAKSCPSVVRCCDVSTGNIIWERGPGPVPPNCLDENGRFNPSNGGNYVGARIIEASATYIYALIEWQSAALGSQPRAWTVRVFDRTTGAVAYEWDGDALHAYMATLAVDEETGNFIIEAAEASGSATTVSGFLRRYVEIGGDETDETATTMTVPVDWSAENPRIGYLGQGILYQIPDGSTGVVETWWNWAETIVTEALIDMVDESIIHDGEMYYHYDPVDTGYDPPYYTGLVMSFEDIGWFPNRYAGKLSSANHLLGEYDPVNDESYTYTNGTTVVTDWEDELTTGYYAERLGDNGGFGLEARYMLFGAAVEGVEEIPLGSGATDYDKITDTLENYPYCGTYEDLGGPPPHNMVEPYYLMTGGVETVYGGSFWADSTRAPYNMGDEGLIIGPIAFSGYRVTIADADFDTLKDTYGLLPLGNGFSEGGLDGPVSRRAAILAPAFIQFLQQDPTAEGYTYEMAFSGPLRDIAGLADTIPDPFVCISQVAPASIGGAGTLTSEDSIYYDPDIDYGVVDEHYIYTSTAVEGITQADVSTHRDLLMGADLFIPYSLHTRTTHHKARGHGRFTLGICTHGGGTYFTEGETELEASTLYRLGWGQQGFAINVPYRTVTIDSEVVTDWVSEPVYLTDELALHMHDGEFYLFAPDDGADYVPTHITLTSQIEAFFADATSVVIHDNALATPVEVNKSYVFWPVAVNGGDYAGHYYCSISRVSLSLTPSTAVESFYFWKPGTEFNDILAKDENDTIYFAGPALPTLSLEAYR